MSNEESARALVKELDRFVCEVSEEVCCVS